MHTLRFTAALAAALFTVQASAAEIQELRSDDTLLKLGPYSFDNGKTLNLTVGVGSAAFRHPSDPPNVMWTLGDRGPNFACSEAKGVMDGEIAACKDAKPAGRVYLAPSYNPSIYRLMLLEDRFVVTDVIKLKDADGVPLNGMPNPLKTATTETPLDGKGAKLHQDVKGIDAEGIVRLTDGTFWISDENGPSIAHFAADGRMIERHVPKGTEGDYAGTKAKVIGSLPAILTKRQANRGIEGLAISPDEQFLYFIVQNPLANPDSAAYQKARNTRLFKVARATMQIVGEYVYTLDDPKSFRRDPSERQSDPRISELMGIGADRVVVLERTEQTTKLYEVELAGATNISGSRWDDLATAPTLEQTEVAAVSVTPVKKTLRFDSADFPAVVGKTEGMALLGDGTLAIVNDDDFGISGQTTQVVLVRGSGIARH